jgi:anti-sigma factor RsiW
MSCEDYNEAIGELVDGTIRPKAKEALERHLQTCQACRSLVADLRRIHEAAASLPPTTPPLTLWPRIANRLKARGVEEVRAGQAGRVEEAGQAGSERVAGRGWFRSLGSWVLATPARAAAVASSAVLVLAAATVMLLFRPGPGPRGAAPGTGTTAATAPATAPAAAGSAPVNANNAELVQSVEMELSQAEQHYEKAIVGLEQIAKAGEGTLDPQIAATLQKNLAVIDRAIQESRTALQSQPTSQLAQESLFEAFKRKVALLQDTIALINEMRKGNQAGAAKIMQNMKRS